jgi:hypothetical protein
VNKTCVLDKSRLSKHVRIEMYMSSLNLIYTLEVTSACFWYDIVSNYKTYLIYIEIMPLGSINSTTRSIKKKKKPLGIKN